MQQRSEEWFAARLGAVTASRVADVVAKTSKGWGAGRANYMAQLIAERLTGERQETFTSAAMQHGTDTEDEARDAYAFYRDATVIEAPFVPHPSIAEAGASPDGFVGDDGLLELKCPNTATHLDTLERENVPSKYIKQMQWQMACTGRKWVDFASYDPRLPEPMRLFVKRVDRDDEMIADLENAVADFLEEVRKRVSDMRKRFDLEPPANIETQYLMAG